MSIIIQPAFEIPLDIAERLATGELIRYGGVIRDAAGRLVTHLKEVQLPTSNEQTIMSKIANALTTSKGKAAVAIGLGVVVVGGVAFWVVGKKIKKKQLAVLEMAKSIESYNASLCAYLDAIRNRSVDINIIDNLISDLDNIRVNGENGKISIVFSPEQLDTLVNLVFDYTKKLAEANSYSLLEEIKKPSPASTDNAITGLRHYLEVQKRIFEKTA